jgi:hypothetical protein
MEITTTITTISKQKNYRVDEDEGFLIATALFIMSTSLKVKL